MSYDEFDAARDEFYDTLRRELYDEHKEEAIAAFTAERLRSFYDRRPDVMRPAVDAIQEGKWQQSNSKHSAALIFHVSAIELLLKATLLKPVIYGLVHNEALAEVVVRHTLSQTGFDRYEALLAELFRTLAKVELNEIRRGGQSRKLLDECKALQSARNKVIHQGVGSTAEDAETARLVAVAVFEMIVQPMLFALGLTVRDRGEIVAV
jgi:hypothetical protein